MLPLQFVKELHIFVISAYFRVFQGNKTNKENMHLKIMGIVRRNLIRNRYNAKIKFISNQVLY